LILRRYQCSRRQFGRLAVAAVALGCARTSSPRSPSPPPPGPRLRVLTAVGTIRRQLDHIAHSASLEAVSVEVRPSGRSDHLPVVAVLRPI
jgi:endonuclease/exonuclease/phosphatase family metal-dependent hydrolase